MPDFKPFNFCGRYHMLGVSCRLCFDDSRCGSRDRTVAPEGFNQLKSWMQTCVP